MASFLKDWLSSSLTRETMLKMGLRITLVIIAVTLLSYWHISDTLEEQTYDNLQNYITERGQKESAIFIQAEDNHRVFRDAFLAAWPKALGQPSQARFDTLFFEPNDGTWRMRPKWFEGVRRSDGTISRHISAYIGKDVVVDGVLRSKLLLSYDLVDRYAEGWSHLYSSLYVTMPDNVILIHWPFLAWGLETDALLDINNEEWGYISNAENNPARESVWTGLFYGCSAN